MGHTLTPTSGQRVRDTPERCQCRQAVSAGGAQTPGQIRWVTCGKDGLRRCWRRDPKAAGSSDCPIGHDFQPKDPAPTAKWAGPRRGSGGDRTVRDSSGRRGVSAGRSRGGAPLRAE